MMGLPNCCVAIDKYRKILISEISLLLVQVGIRDLYLSIDVNRSFETQIRGYVLDRYSQAQCGTISQRHFLV